MQETPAPPLKAKHPRAPHPALGCLLGAILTGSLAYALLFVVHRLFIEGRQNSAPEVFAISTTDLVVVAMLLLSPFVDGIVGFIWAWRRRRVSQ